MTLLNIPIGSALKRALSKLRKKFAGGSRSDPQDIVMKTKPAPTPKNLPNAPKPVMFYDETMPTIPSEPRRVGVPPVISFVVVIYRMSQQARRTLYSLSASYQVGVDENDYELIVVENDSEANLGQQAAEETGNNVRYFHRLESEPTPVHAVNFGVEKARGTHVCIMIDGARMVTPGVVNFMLAALRLHPRALVSVPGYHLGLKVQQEAMLEGYDENYEQSLLTSIKWPENGYDLFKISCFSGTSANGFFRPIGESNCLCMSKEFYHQIGGCDPRFNESGGGQVNLDLYKRACETPESILVTLLGEGSFHQFHGGVTTGQQGEARKKAMEAHFAQYARIRGEPYSPPTCRSIYFGTLPDSALKFVHHSAERVLRLRAELDADNQRVEGV